MNRNKVQRTLSKGEIYESDGGSTVCCSNPLIILLDTLHYYLGMIFIIVYGSLYARFEKFDDKIWAEHSNYVLKLVESCKGKITIDGSEHAVGAKCPVVYIANHMSMLETMLLPGVLLTFGRLSIVVKESLQRYPVFGSIMRAVKPISIGRKNPREDLKKVLTKGTEFIKQGRSVLIFPQSTRNVKFNPGLFNSLGIKLAKKAGVPVVPLAVKTDFHGIGRKPFKDFGWIDRSKHVRLRFGASFIVGVDSRQAHERVVAFILETLESWNVNPRLCI